MAHSSIQLNYLLKNQHSIDFFFSTLLIQSELQLSQTDPLRKSKHLLLFVSSCLTKDFKDFRLQRKLFVFGLL